MEIPETKQLRESSIAKASDITADKEKQVKRYTDDGKEEVDSVNQNMKNVGQETSKIPCIQKRSSLTIEEDKIEPALPKTEAKKIQSILHVAETEDSGEFVGSTKEDRKKETLQSQSETMSLSVSPVDIDSNINLLRQSFHGKKLVFPDNVVSSIIEDLIDPSILLMGPLSKAHALKKDDMEQVPCIQKTTSMASEKLRIEPTLPETEAKNTKSLMEIPETKQLWESSIAKASDITADKEKQVKRYTDDGKEEVDSVNQNMKKVGQETSKIPCIQKRSSLTMEQDKIEPALPKTEAKKIQSILHVAETEHSGEFVGSTKEDRKKETLQSQSETMSLSVFPVDIDSNINLLRQSFHGKTLVFPDNVVSSIIEDLIDPSILLMGPLSKAHALKKDDMEQVPCIQKTTSVASEQLRIEPTLPETEAKNTKSLMEIAETKQLRESSIAKASDITTDKEKQVKRYTDDGKEEVDSVNQNMKKVGQETSKIPCIQKRSSLTMEQDKIEPALPKTEAKKIQSILHVAETEHSGEFVGSTKEDRKKETLQSQSETMSLSVSPVDIDSNINLLRQSFHGKTLVFPDNVVSSIIEDLIDPSILLMGPISKAETLEGTKELNARKHEVPVVETLNRERQIKTSPLENEVKTLQGEISKPPNLLAEKEVTAVTDSVEQRSYHPSLPTAVSNPEYNANDYVNQNAKKGDLGQGPCIQSSKQLKIEPILLETEAKTTKSFMEIPETKHLREPGILKASVVTVDKEKQVKRSTDDGKEEVDSVSQHMKKEGQVTSRILCIQKRYSLTVEQIKFEATLLEPEVDKCKPLKLRSDKAVVSKASLLKEREESQRNDVVQNQSAKKPYIPVLKHINREKTKPFTKGVKEQAEEYSNLVSEKQAMTKRKAQTAECMMKQTADSKQGVLAVEISPKENGHKNATGARPKRRAQTPSIWHSDIKQSVNNLATKQTEIEPSLLGTDANSEIDFRHVDPNRKAEKKKATRGHQLAEACNNGGAKMTKTEETLTKDKKGAQMQRESTEVDKACPSFTIRERCLEDFSTWYSDLYLTGGHLEQIHMKKFIEYQEMKSRRDKLLCVFHNSLRHLKTIARLAEIRVGNKHSNETCLKTAKTVREKWKRAAFRARHAALRELALIWDKADFTETSISRAPSISSATCSSTDQEEQSLDRRKSNASDIDKKRYISRQQDAALRDSEEYNRRAYFHSNMKLFKFVNFFQRQYILEHNFNEADFDYSDWDIINKCQQAHERKIRCSKIESGVSPEMERKRHTPCQEKKAPILQKDATPAQANTDLIHKQTSVETTLLPSSKSEDSNGNEATGQKINTIKKKKGRKNAVVLLSTRALQRYNL
ncbi:uncharacterized protein LOC106153975 [Lingula anatina]|uniref:Uncharacterized protein LOC106153975 n=1 Tax=Lingula anatina TaxID=7574 RepID=A0A1S3HC39_LINAN|nr:uncharacterized protein LOC106153975 [Lingula anatina]|eukprot:XP_013383592.1 uncharacterized protein LOC106153975 [Lingula anatina]